MQKRIMFLILPVVCVLGFFVASAIEEKVEYRYFDHPRMLCGSWFWEIRDGSGYNLYPDGTGIEYNKDGEKHNLKWICKNGVMRMDGQVLWTEYYTESNGNLVCTNEGKEAEAQRCKMILCRPR